MTRPPRVVACVPTYNAAEFVTETLASLAAQTYANLEIVVSVDRSDDDTFERCAGFARADARIRVLRQQTRLGWVGNSNLLFGQADAEYLFLAPHDDVLEPEYVVRLMERLEGRDDAVVAFSDMETIDKDGRRSIDRYRELDDVTDRVERGRRLLARRHAWWAPFRGIMRSAALRRVGGLRRNLAGEFAADWTFLVHLSLLGEFIRVPEVLYHKRYRTTSTSRQWRRSTPQWFAATLSCAGAIIRADLTGRERRALLAELCRCTGRRAIGRIQGRPGPGDGRT